MSIIIASAIGAILGSLVVIGAIELYERVRDWWQLRRSHQEFYKKYGFPPSDYP